MPYKLGTELHPADRARVLAAYVHRYTRDHIPGWAKTPRPDGTPYPIQFASDADWLAHTKFLVRTDGRLDRRGRHCLSTPTWPDGKPPGNKCPVCVYGEPTEHTCDPGQRHRYEIEMRGRNDDY